MKTLKCIVLPTDAGYQEAFKANRDHGLPLSVQDRKVFACWLHEQQPGWSLRKIGQECGLNHETVRRALQGEVSTDRHAVRTQPTPAECIVDLICKEQRLRRRDVESAIERYGEEYWAAIAKEVIATGQAMVEGGKRYVR